MSEEHKIERFSLYEVARLFESIRSNVVLTAVNRLKIRKVDHATYEGDKTALIMDLLKHGRKLKETVEVAPPSLPEPEQSPEESQNYEALIKENNQQARRIRQLTDMRQTWQDIFASAVQAVPKPDIIPGRASRTSRVGKFPFVAVHQFSDWHDQIEPLAEYTRRADLILSDLGGELVGHVLSFGGDEVHGTAIFPGQAFEYRRSCAEQMVRAGKAKVELCKWAAGYGVPVTALQVEGNHARAGELRGGQSHFHDNWDYASGLFAQSHTGDWVDWHFTATSEGWYIKIPVAGFTLISCHGNHIKSHSRTPFYGLETYARATLEQLEGEERNQPRLVLVHHFHSFAQFTRGGTRVSMNGSLQGFTEYAAQKGFSPSPKSQTMLILKADDRPLVWGEHEIFCE